MLSYVKRHSLSLCTAMATAVVVAVIAMCTFLLPNFTAFAAPLGSETPEIYCTFSQNNEQVDGNTLAAGTYDVSFNIKGVEAFSTLQLTATYDSTVTVGSPVSLIGDTKTDVTSMGPVIDNTTGNLVFGFVSNNAENSAINVDGEVLATVSMTFAEACDAAQVIHVSTNPHQTFLQTNYNDGYADEYALVSNSEAVDYSGVLYPMSCDITPSNGRNVSGSLVIMKDSKGGTDNKVPYGVYTINVYDTPDMETAQPIKTINTVYTVDSNSFTIDALSSGTYYLSISSDYALPRKDIVLTMGENDITGVVIPVVPCDYNQDSAITLADVSYIYGSMAKDAPMYDLNIDGSVSIADAGYVYPLLGATYNGFEIK